VMSLLLVLRCAVSITVDALQRAGLLKVEP
jgi:hypothetical protein